MSSHHLFSSWNEEASFDSETFFAMDPIQKLKEVEMLTAKYLSKTAKSIGAI